jgi:hypothetical protein
MAPKTAAKTLLHEAYNLHSKNTFIPFISLNGLFHLKSIDPTGATKEGGNYYEN